MNEFATLLTVGATALRRLIDNVEPASKHEADELLREIDAIADRLHAIAREISARN